MKQRTVTFSLANSTFYKTFSNFIFQQVQDVIKVFHSPQITLFFKALRKINSNIIQNLIPIRLLFLKYYCHSYHCHQMKSQCGCKKLSLSTYKIESKIFTGTVLESPSMTKLMESFQNTSSRQRIGKKIIRRIK